MKYRRKGFNRKKPRTIPRWLGWLLAVLYLSGAFGIDYFIGHGFVATPMTIFWRALIILSFFQLGILFRKRGVTDHPVAKGRLIALIPAYNEEEGILYQAIEALLEQTRPPDEIHVMDDGSNRPIRPYGHPKVFWHRQENQGKRYAQVNILRTLNHKRVDFIMTVDSDSITNIYACETMLRAFSVPKIEGVTGMIYTLNYRKNLLTRILDINMGVGCLIIEASRNAMAAQETTCGPLAMYRARVLFDNMDDYVTSGTFGDDRRLNIYALLYGDTLGIQKAETFTSAPDTMRELIRQRLRWARSPWIQLPFMLINLKPKQLVYPILSVIQWAIMLIIYFLVAYFCIVYHSVDYLLIFLAATMFSRIVQSTLYLYIRPDMKLSEKVFMLFVITPLEVLIRFFLLVPLKTVALFQLREKSWGTRS